MTIPDFADIKKNCNGMLSSKVYSTLHEIAKTTHSGTLAVEVGAAHAAGTVSMALGIQKNPTLENLISFEKIEGGSRMNFGNFKKNKEIINGNIESYGCKDVVEMVFSTPEEAIDKIPFDGQPNIGLLVIDADGAIDREFNLLYDRVVEGGVVVIDDYNDYLKYFHLSKHRVHIDAKHKVTKALVDYYVNEGFLKFDKMVQSTWFGYKPKGAGSISKSNPISVYRNLIHLDVDFKNTKSWGRKAERTMFNVLKKLRSWFPGPYNGMLKVKHRLEKKSVK